MFLRRNDFIFLVRIYRQACLNQLEKIHITEFIKILDRAKWSPKGRLRFLGDVFADRGGNDFLMLLLFILMNYKVYSICIMF